MLNTIPFKKKNNTEENFIEKNFKKLVGGENVVEEEIKENNICTENEIAKSFHSMETKIFSGQDNSTKDSFKIENFNFDEITKKYSENVIFDDQKKIMISINKKLQKISLYDDKNNLLGFFTIFHIVKYLGNVHDTKKQFLKDIDDKIYIQAKTIIKKFLFKLRYNKIDKYTDIILYDYTKSGFMGDIELLININKLLFHYLINHMQNDLLNVESNNRIKIEQNIKKFIFLLLNYTLKLISIVSNQIKNNNNNSQLKENLTKYSIEIVYKINLFVQDQLKIINNRNNNIKIALDTNVKIKTLLNKKLEELIKNNSVKKKKLKHFASH